MARTGFFATGNPQARYPKKLATPYPPQVPVRPTRERRIRLAPDGSKRGALSMGLSYRWVIVGVGALMICVGIGAMFSLPVYLQPMSRETPCSRARVFWAPHHGNIVRSRNDGVEPGHGLRTLGRRHDFRYLPRLSLALYRLAECRSWRDGGGARVSGAALPVACAAAA